MFMALSSHAGADAPETGPAQRAPASPRLVVHTQRDPDRAEVEAYIRRIYADHYGADVQGFAPELVSLRDGSGIVAAAGYRSAAHGPLFLERYLDAPIETLLTSTANAATQRPGVVEVGHLASDRPGEGRRLILLLGPHLAAQGFQWVVSTLTAELRHLFVRIGVTPLALGTADPAALGHEAVQWGSYYDHRPVVLAGHLRQALQQLARRQARRGGAA